MSEPLLKAIENLAAADRPSALIAAHQAIRRAVRKQRTKEGKEWGVLAATYHEAMRIWDQQLAEGVSLAEREAGLERTLRASWPKGRELDWKYLCEACGDYGLVINACPGDATCGRKKPHIPHSFGHPCWCSAGKRHQEKPKGDDGDFRNAGKNKPTQSMTRFGR